MPCSTLKQGDIAAVGRSGWMDNPKDRGFWIALTAPGEAGGLPFDRALCTHSPGVDCSGKIGCQVEAEALAIWHATLPQRWSWFVTSLRRLLPGVDVQFFKTYEPQARGALHAHSMMRATGIVTDGRFKAAVRRAASLNGFGSQFHCTAVDLSDSETIARRAGYAAKYSAKCSDILPTVRRLDVSTGEVTHGGMRSWSASWDWGARMKQIRQKRIDWASSTDWAGAEADGVGAASPGGEAALDMYQDFYAPPSDCEVITTWSVGGPALV